MAFRYHRYYPGPVCTFCGLVQPLEPYNLEAARRFNYCQHRAVLPEADPSPQQCQSQQPYREQSYHSIHSVNASPWQCQPQPYREQSHHSIYPANPLHQQYQPQPCQEQSQHSTHQANNLPQQCQPQAYQQVQPSIYPANNLPQQSQPHPSQEQSQFVFQENQTLSNPPKGFNDRERKKPRRIQKQPREDKPRQTRGRKQVLEKEKLLLSLNADKNQPSSPNIPRADPENTNAAGQVTTTRQDIPSIKAQPSISPVVPTIIVTEAPDDIAEPADSSTHTPQRTSTPSLADTTGQDVPSTEAQPSISPVIPTIIVTAEPDVIAEAADSSTHTPQRASTPSLADRVNDHLNFTGAVDSSTHNQENSTSASAPGALEDFPVMAFRTPTTSGAQDSLSPQQQIFDDHSMLDAINDSGVLDPPAPAPAQQLPAKKIEKSIVFTKSGLYLIDTKTHDADLTHDLSAQANQQLKEIFVLPRKACETGAIFMTIFSLKGAVVAIFAVEDYAKHFPMFKKAFEAAIRRRLLPPKPDFFGYDAVVAVPPGPNAQAQLDECSALLHSLGGKPIPHVCSVDSVPCFSTVAADAPKMAAEFDGKAYQNLVTGISFMDEKKDPHDGMPRVWLDGQRMR
ncbi:hypothetical protein HDK90DRAFT_544598 [Phyllosticta capitalensis]|uniref:Uncharacterized protein n=1 Tax=Phyllosticta capitalensis TaxID=121624 RepID=A0ABR1Y903_9PEZI